MHYFRPNNSLHLENVVRYSYSDLLSHNRVIYPTTWSPTTLGDLSRLFRLFIDKNYNTICRVMEYSRTIGSNVRLVPYNVSLHSKHAKVVQGIRYKVT